MSSSLPTGKFSYEIQTENSPDYGKISFGVDGTNGLTLKELRKHELYGDFFKYVLQKCKYHKGVVYDHESMRVKGWDYGEDNWYGDKRDGETIKNAPTCHMIKPFLFTVENIGVEEPPVTTTPSSPSTTGTGIPDIAAYNGGPAPIGVCQGNTFSVTTGTIQNVGTAASGPYTITYYALLNSEYTTLTSIWDFGMVIGTFTNRPTIPAGQITSHTANGLSSASLNAGNEYYIGWKISDVANEAVTNNNAASLTTRMLIVPPCTPTTTTTSSTSTTTTTSNVPISDLIAINGGIIPSSVVKGTTFTVTSGNIYNDGNITNSFTITYYAISILHFDTPTALWDNGTIIGTFNVSQLIHMGETITHNGKGLSTDNLPTGEYYIGWKITNVPGEVNTSNNTAYCHTTTMMVTP